MSRARAAWRLLHGPDGSQEPVALMLPKLVRQVPAPGSAEAAAAAAAAAAARLEQAEAAAQAAVLRAASLAAASGLPYRPPEGLNISLAGIPVVSPHACVLECQQGPGACRMCALARSAAASANQPAAAGLVPSPPASNAGAAPAPIVCPRPT